MARSREDSVQTQGYAAVELRLSAGEARAMLRRQFIGSVAAAVVVMAAVGLTAMRASHGVADDAAAHRMSAVQQPIFVTPTDRVIALRKY